MNRAVLFLVVMLGVAGCANRSWYHPSKSQDEFHQEKYSCTQQAAQTYPVLIQQESYGVARTTPSQTTCITTYGQVKCTTTPGTYTPPPTNAVDVNEGNRNNAFNSCMNSMGWSLLNQEQVVAVQKQGGSKVDTVNQQIAQLEKDQKELCNREKYKAIYQKSPCGIDNANLEQLADQTKISANEKSLFMAWHGERDSILKRRVAIYRSAGKPTATNIADLFERTRIKDENNALALYEGKLTWGEYNKTRKDIASTGRQEYFTITSKK